MGRRGSSGKGVDERGENGVSVGVKLLRLYTLCTCQIKNLNGESGKQVKMNGRPTKATTEID